MVRNEVDLIRVNVLHHLALGLDRLLIVDNGSTDGTSQVLTALSGDPRVRWTRDTGPYRQAEIWTELAQEAHKEGADWVVPVDADEFLHCRGGKLKDVLARTGADVLRARIIDFIQRREQRLPSPEALLHMTRRVAEPLPRSDRVREAVAANRSSYVEMARVSRCISRTGDHIEIAPGGHQVAGVEGPLEETEELVFLHTPLPSLAKLEAKALIAERAAETFVPRAYWHVSRWQELRGVSGGLEQEWAANSYADEHLDVYGSLHPVIFDPTLRDLLAPWLRPSLRNRWRSKRRILFNSLQSAPSPPDAAARRRPPL